LADEVFLTAADGTGNTPQQVDGHRNR